MITKFVENAKEIEMDAVSKDGKVNDDMLLELIPNKCFRIMLNYITKGCSFPVMRFFTYVYVRVLNTRQ